MKSGQKGFTVVETLLVLILLAIIGFTGYYVWHSQKNANSNLNSAVTTSSKTQTATNSNKFVFKELGVQIDLPNSLKDLKYDVSSLNGTTYLNLTTPEYNAALLKCDPSSTSGGTIVSIAKIPGQFNQDENIGSGNLHQFKDFWISGASPNGIVCADSASDQDKAEWQTSFQGNFQAVKNAFETATLVKT